MNIKDFIFRRESTPAVRAVSDMAKNYNRVTSKKTSWHWGDTNPFATLLTKTDLKKYYWGNEIVFKGLNKKARDVVYDWFELDNPIDGEDVPEAKENQFKDFVKQKKVKYKLHNAVLDSLKYGNGWVELICQGNKESEEPLNGKLTDIEIVNPETIIGYKWDENKHFVEYWIQKVGTEKIVVHHTRLLQIAFYRNGDEPFGISPLEVAKSTIKYDNEGSEALAKNADLFGNPILTINTTDNSNTNQVDDAFTALGKFKRKMIRVGLAGFKDTKFGMLNPSTPNPQSALNNTYIHLAAALEMPMMLLIGEQKGKLTGSEIELNDYYKSIGALQNIHITPVINRILELYFGNWEYDLLWNPLFVDEKTEIANKATLMDKYGELYQKHGLTDVIETRQLLREAGVNIPENGELDEIVDEDEIEEDIGVVEPVEPEEEKKTLNYHYATKAEEEISRMIIKQAEHEHELGVKEIKKQKERCK